MDYFFFENEQGEAITVNDDRYRAMLNEFLFTKIEEEAIANIWFQQDGTRPKLHSMFSALFLKIALSAVELMSLGHLEAAIWPELRFDTVGLLFVRCRQR